MSRDSRPEACRSERSPPLIQRPPCHLALIPGTSGFAMEKRGNGTIEHNASPDWRERNRKLPGRGGNNPVWHFGSQRAGQYSSLWRSKDVSKLGRTHLAEERLCVSNITSSWR